MKNIEELITEIERRATAKKDFVVNTANIEMRDDASLAFGDHQTEASDLAHSQIGQTIGIPKVYYDKMRQESPKLLANNVNEWFRKYPADRMLRTLDGGLRAFMSAKYRRLENDQLAAAILPVAMGANLIPIRCDITDNRLYLKFVDKKITEEVPHFGAGGHEHFKTSVLHPAITIANSEVGLGAMAVIIGYFDEGCTNLSFPEKAIRKSHVGARHEVSEGFEALFSSETQKLSDDALFAQVSDVMKGAFDAARFAQVADKLRGTAKAEIKGDPVKVVEMTAARFSLGNEVKTSILKRLIEGADLSQWGLSSAMTRAAQDVADVDLQNDMEKFGGAIVDLPVADWRELAMAA